jgi:transcriptional regulator of acetoin/glycerol metabolism
MVWQRYVIQYGCMMTENTVIDIKDLPEVLRSSLAPISTTDETMAPLDEVMKRHVLRVLSEVRGNKTRAAKVLGIRRATVYELLAKWSIESLHTSADTAGQKGHSLG